MPLSLSRVASTVRVACQRLRLGFDGKQKTSFGVDLNLVATEHKACRIRDRESPRHGRDLRLRIGLQDLNLAWAAS